MLYYAYVFLTPMCLDYVTFCQYNLHYSNIVMLSYLMLCQCNLHYIYVIILHYIRLK